MPITGTIITLNEADNIAACIQSLQRVCDEVIVVDSFSEDDTVAIAEAQDARVIEQAYLGDGPQKAHAVPYAKNDWILALDADERLDDDAVALIKSLPLDNPELGYSFRRKNHVGQHWIRAGGFYPNSAVRLYNRTQAGYLQKQAHSSVEAPRVKKTQVHIRHYTYDSLSHWIERINVLSTRDAWAKKNRGMRPSTLRPILHATVAIFRKLILKGGLFKGADGFTVAATTGFHVYMKYAKLNEMYENEASNGDA